MSVYISISVSATCSHVTIFITFCPTRHVPEISHPVQNHGSHGCNGGGYIHLGRTAVKYGLAFNIIAVYVPPTQSSVAVQTNMQRHQSILMEINSIQITRMAHWKTPKVDKNLLFGVQRSTAGVAIYHIIITACDVQQIPSRGSPYIFPEVCDPLTNCQEVRAGCWRRSKLSTDLSNLTFMSKFIEKILYQQIIPRTAKHASKYQSGFRAHHSTQKPCSKSSLTSLVLLTRATCPCSVFSTCRPRSTRLIMISSWSGWRPLSGWPALAWTIIPHRPITIGLLQWGGVIP